MSPAGHDLPWRMASGHCRYTSDSGRNHENVIEARPNFRFAPDSCRDRRLPGAAACSHKQKWPCVRSLTQISLAIISLRMYSRSHLRVLHLTSRAALIPVRKTSEAVTTDQAVGRMAARDLPCAKAWCLVREPDALYQRH